MIGSKAVVATALLLACTAGLAGCSSAQTDGDASLESAANATAAATAAQFQEATFDADGNVIIDAASITEDATYINCDVDGTNVQLIALRASDGTPRVSYNTCQSCNPSPEAYFTQDGGTITCQNCGNQFSADVVGTNTGEGCNPMYIEGLAQDGDTITVPAADLQAHVEAFTTWQGPIA